MSDDPPVDVVGPGRIVRRESTHWDVRALTGAGYRIHFRDRANLWFRGPEYPTIQVVDRHPVLNPQGDPTSSLYFNGTSLNPRDLAERVDRAIRDSSEPTRSLSDYNSSVEAASKQLAARHGMLLSAPEPVCVAAAGVLEAEGVGCSIVGSTPPRTGFRALLLGRSYVVAKGFSFERLQATDLPAAVPPINNDDFLAELRAGLIEGMREFMADAGGDYAASDIAECEAILVDHLTAIRGAASREAALECVRETVLRLNALNARCGGTLIETNQREDICDLIIRTGYLAGFNGEDEDVTEEWRDW